MELQYLISMPRSSHNVSVKDIVLCAAIPHHQASVIILLGFWDIKGAGLIKDGVYVPPLPTDLPDLRHRIEAAVARITLDTLNKVKDELVYRLDVCRMTNGAHIEHL
ncbi:uncharacterized protein TNCV_1685151 [Trichonephila clavipes]|nr:uncharacterized protein TNCV_1685151 [Trichonephila clavipes]